LIEILVRIGAKVNGIVGTWYDDEIFIPNTEKAFFLDLEGKRTPPISWSNLE